MKKWIGLAAVFVLLIGILVGILAFLWISPGIFFAVSISESALANLKLFALAAGAVILIVIGLLSRK